MSPKTRSQLVADARRAIRSGRPPLDVEAAGEYIGTSARHVRRLVAERRIPFLRVGGRLVRLDPDDLDDWLLASRVEAVG